MKDCKYKIIQIICIISLVCVFVVQVLFILKKSWVGDVLNPTKIASKVDNNNLIYGMALDIVKFKMNDKTSSNISLENIFCFFFIADIKRFPTTYNINRI